MSEPYVEICEAGHRHARLEPSDGCPFCLREGKVALQQQLHGTVTTEYHDKIVAEAMALNAALQQDALEDAEWAEACDVRNDILQQQVRALESAANSSYSRGYTAGQEVTDALTSSSTGEG
jgi:hypothetical protein